MNSKLLLLSKTKVGGAPFVFTINTALGTGASFLFPLKSGYNHDFVADMGDGNEVVYSGDGSTPPSYSYSIDGTYQISVSGICESWSFANTGDKLKPISVNQWGDVGFTYLNLGFDFCSNLTSIPDGTGSEVFKNILLAQRMFRGTKITNFDNYNTYNADLSFICSSVATLISVSGNTFSSPAWTQAFVFITNTFTFDFTQEIGAPTTLQQMFTGSNINVVNLSTLDISNLTNANFEATLSTSEYDSFLIAAEAQFPTGNTFVLDAKASKYTLGGAAEAARTSLINNYGITVEDGGGI